MKRYVAGTLSAGAAAAFLLLTPATSFAQEDTSFSASATASAVATQGAAAQKAAQQGALSNFGEAALDAIRKDKAANAEFHSSIAERDLQHKYAGADSKAKPAGIRGLVEPTFDRIASETSNFSRPPPADAAIVIGGVNSTWHAMEKWLPLIAERVDGPIYAYEGLRGPGRQPHNADYAQDNISAIADALIAIREGANGKAPASSILLQTYSFGGIAAQGAIQELAARKDAQGQSELSKFKAIDLIAIAPPDCGFSVSDALLAIPSPLMEWIAKPATKALGFAMSADMGTQSALFKTISQPHPSNVRITSIRAVGDTVSSPIDAASADRKSKVLAQADAIITLVADHDSGVDPTVFARQGVDPYAWRSQTAPLASQALLHAQAQGINPEAYFPMALAHDNSTKNHASAAAGASSSEAIAMEMRVDLKSRLDARRTPAVAEATPSAKPAQGI